MWALIFRITGGRLQSSVPGFLASASATHSCIDYMERCAGELARDPLRYSFDPGCAYTVMVQTWDGALSAARSLAFGRDKLGHEAVGLIPDVYYLDSGGYLGLRASAQMSPAWADRDPSVVWRGSVTGRGSYADYFDIPRVKLASQCSGVRGVDVKLMGVHDTMQNTLDVTDLEAVLKAQDLLGERWEMSHFADFKYVVDIDGYANAWSFVEKLVLGCCVLKVESAYEQWFYGRLSPWVHYIPVKSDLSDLLETLAWCRENEALCEWIAGNGARLAASMTYQSELQRSCEQIMIAARVTPITA